MPMREVPSPHHHTLGDRGEWAQATYLYHPCPILPIPPKPPIPPIPPIPHRHTTHTPYHPYHLLGSLTIVMKKVRLLKRRWGRQEPQHGVADKSHMVGQTRATTWWGRQEPQHGVADARLQNVMGWWGRREEQNYPTVYHCKSLGCCS